MSTETTEAPKKKRARKERQYRVYLANALDEQGPIGDYVGEASALTPKAAARMVAEQHVGDDIEWTSSLLLVAIPQEAIHLVEVERQISWKVS